MEQQLLQSIAQGMTQLTQYMLYGLLIQTGGFLIMLGMLIYGLVQLRRDNREILHEIGNIGAMTQNVAAMTREVLRRTE